MTLQLPAVLRLCMADPMLRMQEVVALASSWWYWRLMTAILRRYGGLYSDLDIEAIKPFDAVFHETSASVVLAYMGSDWMYEHNLPNAWFASKPG
jgi:hypothetical protein